MELKNKVVIITGGTKGLGKAMALSFIEEGAHVLVCARNQEELDSLPENIIGIKADVTKEDELDNLLEYAIKKFGQIDIWINNAGLWLPHSQTEDFDMDKVKKMFDVNVFGTMNGCRVALRYMKEKNIGTIINIISDSALLGRPMSSMYCASKWAINGYTKSIKEENENISVIAIYPGAMKTDIFGDSKPENFDNFMEVEYVSDLIIENIKKEKPEEELIIQK
jgi:NAD(P)-dependent dehydrogenase (short-subunit alcohol dehydrogenase family)